MKPSDDIVRTANEFANRKPDETDGFIALNLARAILAHIDTHAGGERVFNAATYAVLGEPDAHAGGATLSERVPSAVEVTVEEWEALEFWINAAAAETHRAKEQKRLARDAFRKLNARAALSKSETTQPATGDGAGAARMFQLWAEGYGNEQTWGGLANNERAVWTEAFEFARELGAKEAQPHRIAVRVLRERDELKEKLAAAVEALEETRWSPDGAIAEWANTPDGKNHARVMRALGVLREEKT